jgi:hypothetical protein
MTVATDIHTTLAHFTGTEGYHRIGMFGTHLFTDGVNFLFQNEVSWLVTDILAHLAHNPKCRFNEFNSIDLVVTAGTAKLTITDGDETVLDTQDYEYTDLPDGTIGMFCTQVDERQWVLMLKSEY